MRKKSLVHLPVALAVAAALGACSGDDERDARVARGRDRRTHDDPAEGRPETDDGVPVLVPRRAARVHDRHDRISRRRARRAARERHWRRDPVLEQPDGHRADAPADRRHSGRARGRQPARADDRHRRGGRQRVSPAARRGDRVRRQHGARRGVRSDAGRPARVRHGPRARRGDRGGRLQREFRAGRRRQQQSAQSGDQRARVRRRSACSAGAWCRA